MRKIKRLIIRLLDLAFPSDIYKIIHKFHKLSRQEFKLKIEDVENFAISLIYKDATREAILDYKYHNKPHYAEYFSKIMAEEILTQFKDVKFSVVVSIPTILEKKNDFDHAEHLARKVATNVLTPYLKNGLLKTRKTEKQHFLNYQQRLENVKNLYRINEKLKYKLKENVLLIDDIVTTGATMASAVRALKAGGAKNVYISSIALTKNLTN